MYNSRGVSLQGHRTALMHASSHGKLELVELFLNHEAEVNLKSTDGVSHITP